MPYPSPVTYPNPALYPGFLTTDGGRKAAIGDLVLGAVDPFGVEWTVKDIDGWPGATGTTLKLEQRARKHGGTANEPFGPPRVMTIDGLVMAPNLAALDAAFDRLNAAVTLNQTTLIVSEAGRARHALVRRHGAVIPTYITDVLGSYSILVSAADPRKFGDLITATTLLPSSTGGRTYPATYPITYTGVSNTGKVQIDNAGNTEAPVWLRVDGPIPAGGWTVTCKSKVFTSSLALAAGEFVTVDMDKQEILAQDQAARAGYVTSRGWFSLDPGPNEISFSAANYSSTALLTVTTKPAWS